MPAEQSGCLMVQPCRQCQLVQRSSDPVPPRAGRERWSQVVKTWAEMRSDIASGCQALTQPKVLVLLRCKSSCLSILLQGLPDR